MVNLVQLVLKDLQAMHFLQVLFSLEEVHYFFPERVMFSMSIDDREVFERPNGKKNRKLKKYNLQEIFLIFIS